MTARQADLAEERYVAALERMRGFIKGGRALELDDSAEIGTRFTHTHCSWGLCAGDTESWPEPEDHLWPELFRDLGRVEPKSLGPEQFCPMDRRAGQPRAPNDLGARWGCFFFCRIFSPKGSPVPGREQVVKLYDIQLARVRRRVS